MDRRLIDRYCSGARVLHEAVEGLNIGELNAFPVPGTWSIQQIVLHIVDSDLIASERMKRIVVEERPPLPSFDENAYAQKLFYDQINIWWACDAFEKNRLITSEILRRLPNEAFQRVGVHSERGEISLGSIVSGNVEHLEHHVGFIRRKRDMLGRPL